MFVGRVTNTFELKGRGVVVSTHTTYEELPPDLKLRIGDSVELRSDFGVLRTKVTGIAHCDPWTPKLPFDFLLPPDVRKEDAPIGAEVWAVD
jgi:hypothetical protein